MTQDFMLLLHVLKIITILAALPYTCVITGKGWAWSNFLFTVKHTSMDVLTRIQIVLAFPTAIYIMDYLITSRRPSY